MSAARTGTAIDERMIKTIAIGVTAHLPTMSTVKQIIAPASKPAAVK